MSHTYRAVGWNSHKRYYDLVAVLSAFACAALIGGGTWLRQPHITVETTLLRAFGGTAWLLLHVVLSIGPLCRLDRRLLPLLYNRRHLGVLTFLFAAAHGGLAIVQFHAFGDRHPLVSLLTTSTGWATADRFPFQIMGLIALAILGVMAATSHDYWLRTLTAPVWKTLHMGVYFAYAALVIHIGFGALQSEAPGGAGALLMLGAVWLASVHTAAAWQGRHGDRNAHQTPDALIDVGPASAIPDTRARIVCAGGERIAVFRYGNKVSAISNVCQHQNGPLGEGKIVGGCVVCPWHGYEYRPDTGAAPAPFTEAVPTFRVYVREGRVLLDPRPLPPRTYVEPAEISA
jgi:nitrite reductase/ring-hydroxylating ferredoxin subunit/DMSO/TMAO reductase YedYZ heme-binding membrane subunit